MLPKATSALKIPVTGLLALLLAAPAVAGELYAHRSGCHRWHSCPSDPGTYICGDTGHCSQCPNNRFCEGGRPRRARAPIPRTAPSPPPEPKPPGATGSSPAGFQTAQVIDGDTLRLVSWGRVRLIGVNAPELKEKLGPMAAQCLKDILEGQRVRLERDVDERDRYGRLLAHVHTESGVYVNAELLRRGCAKLMVIGANVSYLFGLVKAQEEARKAQRGVWTP